MKNITLFLTFVLFVNISNAQEKKSYYDNGQIKEDFNLLNGEFHGICKSYFENGQLERYAKFENGNAIGKARSYYQNGQLKTEVNFIKGLKNGIYKSYSDNGNLSELITYINDEYNGLYEEYHYNGNPRLRGIASPGSGGLGGELFKKEGAWTEWKYYNYDEQLEEKITKLGYKNHGPYELYYEDGDLKEKVNFKNGKKEGESYFFHKGEGQKYKGWYENDELISGEKINE